MSIITGGLSPTASGLISSGYGITVVTPSIRRGKAGDLISAPYAFVSSILIEGIKKFIIKDQYVLTGIKLVDLSEQFNITGIKKVEFREFYKVFGWMLEEVTYQLSLSGVRKTPFELFKGIEGTKRFEIEELLKVKGIKSLEFALVTNLLATKKFDFTDSALLIKGIKQINIKEDKLIIGKRDITNILVALELI